MSHNAAAKLHETDTCIFLRELPISGPNFFGRDLELDQIYNILIPEKSKQKGVVLWGLSGSGKTCLTLRYIKLYLHKYSAVLWIDAPGCDLTGAGQSDLERPGLERATECFSQAAVTIAAEYTSFASRQPANSPKGQDFVKKWLEERSNKSWLTVIDSVDDLDEFDWRSLLPRCNHGTVIVTSTRSRTSISPGFEAVEVGCLGERAACELLLSKSDPAHHTLEGKPPRNLRCLGLLILHT